MNITNANAAFSSANTPSLYTKMKRSPTRVNPNRVNPNLE